MIEIKNVRKKYMIGTTELWALNDVSLKIEKGEFVSLKGPSGSGKSTLLNIIGMLDSPTEGEYFINKESVLTAKKSERNKYRGKHLGFIFQSFNLIPELNIYENVEIPLLISGEKPGTRKKLVLEAIEAVGLTGHIKHRPSQLSGGQMQRVSIARALVKNPPIIIADEPTANLDSKTSAEILLLMKNINREYKTTFVFATHDEGILKYMDKIYYLQDGELLDRE